MAETVPPPLPEPNQASALEEVRDRADTVWTRPRNGRPAPPTGRREARGPHGRVAIVDGCRTPFVKAGSSFQGMDVLDLASTAAAELVSRNGLDGKDVDMAVFGAVLPALHAPNLGREVVFRISLPEWVYGSGVSLACASSNRAIVSAAEAILVGQADVVIAGGAESLSNVPIRFSDNAAHRLMELSKAKSLPQKASVVSKVRPKDLLPVAPAIAEYTTGMTMGQAAEKMAKENDISRRAQDEIALMSHQRSSAATLEGRFAEQVVPTFPPPRYSDSVLVDNGIRHDAAMEKLAALPPVFDKRYGSITAGNASPITDGGSAVLVMSEEKAKALGYQPLGYIRSWAWASVDPGAQLLQGPAYAAPQALEAAGLTLADLDLVEMHEAFAAQLLSNLKAFNSAKFAKDELGRDRALGAVDFDKLNVNGGSIAIGHPFGATGARVTMQLLFELRRRGGNLGLLTVCAAGGVGFAMVVERE